MKSVASTFSIIGIASGVLFALAPVIFGSGNVAPGSFLFPVGFGVLIMATHWLTFRRIRAVSGSPRPFVGMVLPAVSLLPLENRAPEALPHGG